MLADKIGGLSCFARRGEVPTMLQSLIRTVRRSSAHWHTALAVLFAMLLAAELFAFRLLDTTEYRLADLSMVRHASEQRADPDIVVVDIDDASMTAMQEIAGLWSWPREIHADLVAALAEFSPRAIVFDIAFSESDTKRPKSDARLSEEIAAMPRAYLSAVRLLPSFDSTGVPLRTLSEAFGMLRAGPPDAVAALQLPNAVDRSGWRLGLVNSKEDADGVLRRYRLTNDVHGWKLPSLPARVIKDLGIGLPAGDDFLMRWPRIGHKRYAYSELYRVLTEQRPSLNAADVAALGALFRNKIIVIGSSAAGGFDHHLTPLGAGYPGIDVLAVALDNLKNGDAVRPVSPVWPFLFGIVVIAAVAGAFTKRVNPLAIGAGLMVISLVALAIADRAIDHNTLLPVATPLMFAWVWFLVAAIAGYVRERRSREKAVSLFRRFLNPGVVRQIIDQGETIESLSGRTREVTVLFSDIRNFTALSEARPPHEVVALLNRYFDRQVEVVFRHGGTLDKFIGDCIMAFWGAPLDDPEHASHAVAAALEMQQTLLEFKNELAAEGSEVADFDVGIGVHSGPAVVGFIGAQRKLDYTVIGDTVNLASRVEGLTKGVARILITRETMLACQPSGTMNFAAHGAFSVKGRTAEVELFEPMGKAI
jgi:adenylate cyclase